MAGIIDIEGVMSMDSNQSREHVDLIREVFSYNRRFQNALFVLKIDSQIIDHSYFSLLVKDLALLHQNGIKIIIIPGAKDRIDEILTRYEIPYHSEVGVRISTEESINFIKMAAFDVSNKVMTLLSGSNIPSVIGSWVKARALGVVNGVDYQHTGKVDRIRTDAVETLLNEGHIPIFPCIGWNNNGDPYNISSDELATMIARKMEASKLFFLSAEDVLTKQGINLPDDISMSNEGRLSKLSISQAEQFIARNSENPLTGKIRMAVEACREGVNRVHILDGRIEGVVLQEIFSNLGIGTMIYSNIYERIRPMKRQDISSVLSLMKPFINQKILVPRGREELEDGLGDYFVYDMDGIIHGCGGLHLYDDGKAEVAGIAVDSKFNHLKIGRKIVSYLIEQARERRLKAVFVLTTQTSDWFLEMGFTPGTLEDLPVEKREKYNKDRNSRILIYRTE
ncbi:MAG: amino-acid N-acetyltransferase [Spirochaetales bacterium]|nr:amino-acid N-acetyltransferase [Spirochaetales bacterium]